MKEEDKINLDIEIYNLVNSIEDVEEEACFYFRKKGKGLQVGFSGADEDLINSFLTCIKNYPETYDIISTAILLFEEENVAIHEN